MEDLFRKKFGCNPTEIVPLAISGSNRRYWRLSSDRVSAIGVTGLDKDENRAFCSFAKHFRGKGIPVPEVYGVNGDGMVYLQEDLGSESLFSHLNDRDLVKKTISILPKIQVVGAEGLDFSLCHPVEHFDMRSVMFDLNYFKYCYLKPCGIEFNEMLLQDDFETFASDLLSEPSDFFMYRDFQSRNVMVKDGEPFFIDFQGGRRGPLHYDLASFVWQARAGFPEDFRKVLVETYLDSLEQIMPVDRPAFRKTLQLFVLFRTLQVLGCYGFRGLVEKKAQFIESIPAALKNLGDLLPEIPESRYPYMVKILSEMIAKGQNRVMAFIPKGLPEGVLAIDVMSFSFKKGIPEDVSGNGGGYVFDCRGMANPGRYEQYKKLTGLDQPVIDFLEEKGEIQQFLEEAYALVDRHADCFLERGFNHISVFFGCTGGQHRSVYSAEHMAAHLKEKYGDRVHVRLAHRERGIDRVL